MSLQPNACTEAHKKSYKVTIDADEVRHKKEDNLVEICKSKCEESLLKKRKEGMPSLQPGSNGIHLPLEKKLAGMLSNDPNALMEATHHFRKLLSSESNLPIEEVIATGVVPRLVEFITDFPQLQFEAAWALTNIGFGTSDHTKVVVDHGAAAPCLNHIYFFASSARAVPLYQRYYAVLLKKLAPDSLKADESISENATCHGGGLDDLLQKMDQNLARSLPKLCPKPRMLVCAPSNAATDELLTRVLERGFIDGEMKLYQPDVARVGVDTQTRASQAVSVERRSDHLLGMARDDVLGWLQQLRAREAFQAQQMALL